MSSQTELKWVRWRSRLGFPLAAVCLWLARPSAASIVAGGLIAFLGLAIRAAAAGHLRKNETVAMSGPYAHTRNPLYFGSALLVAGFAVASNSWMAGVLALGYYLAMYPFLMRREERELSAVGVVGAAVPAANRSQLKSRFPAEGANPRVFGRVCLRAVRSTRERSICRRATREQS